VDAFGYVNVSVPGYEADDVIASIAEKARQEGVADVIVTGDRDAFQLIGDDGMVKVMATARGITETKLYDRQAVIDRYGIVPELVPDFYGLKGDTSDNIPGDPGIGDKTASDLLQKFGDLEDVLANIDRSRAPSARRTWPTTPTTRGSPSVLATIQRDIAVPIDPTAELVRAPDRSKLREVFREFELRDPLRRLEEALGDPERGAAPPAASTTLAAGARGAAGRSTARCRTARRCRGGRAPGDPGGRAVRRRAGWRWAAAAGDQVVVGDATSPEQVVAALGARPVVAHDAKALGEIPAVLVHDTLLAAYLLEPARRGYPFRELVEERGIGTDVEDPVAADALRIAALAGWQREQLADRGLEPVMAEIELPLVGVLRGMERAGVRLHRGRFAEIKQKVDLEIARLEREVWDLAGEEFVLGSPQQLGHVLFEKLGLSKKRRGKTGFSTDARVLQAIRDEHPIIPLIERWRELNQLAKTYLDVLPALGRRRGPDPHDVPAGRRPDGPAGEHEPQHAERPGAHGARAGDPRLLRGRARERARLRGLLAGGAARARARRDEPVLKDIFLRGEDVHTATASQVFGRAPEELTPMDRSKAKMINYGIVYGLSDYGLADRLNIARDEAKAFIDAYLERFSKVAEFITSTIAQATEQGHVTTLYGRRRQIPELKARNYQVRTLGERLAVNTVIQGTAADVMKLAMIRCHDALATSGLRSRLILTIHDELLFEGPPEEADAVADLARREMTAPWPHEPPLAVDVGTGRTWLDAK
jgi:DNA polymerase-1